MTLYLLDTDSIIDYLANIASTVALLDELQARGETLCTCCIVLAEVCAGLHQPAYARAGPFLSALLFLAVGAAAGVQTGQWRYTFARQGIALATMDCLIAATAQQHGAAVVTGNVRHFPMAGVTVVPLPRVTA